MDPIGASNIQLTNKTNKKQFSKDREQLLKDKKYFERLFAQAKKGNVEAARELSLIPAQASVQENNKNDRLLNANTAYLVQAQNAITPLLNEQQAKQANLIMNELKQNPENNDITEADVQNYILQEGLS